MNSDQFRRYLAKQGCTFEPGRGSHLMARRGDKSASVPQHGGTKQLGTGLMRRSSDSSGSSEGEVMYCYPVELEPDDNDTVLVTFPDVPGAITFGEDEADALARAVDALESMFIAHMSDREDIPKPSPANGRPTVSPTLLGALKLSAYESMRARGWRKADLARAMGLNPRQIDRLLDLRHASTIAQIEQALAVCGKRVEVATLDIAA